MRFWTLCRSAGALVALLLAGGPAWAGTYVIQRAGYWTAFGGTDDAGERLCGIVATGEEGRVFTIKRWADQDHFTLQIFKESWRIPKGEEIRVRLRFDRMEEGSALADSLPPDGIALTVPDNRAEAFLREFAMANTFEMSFPDGNETPWAGNLSGSATITMAFLRCVEKLGGATQPFRGGKSSPGASQPFGKR